MALISMFAALSVAACSKQATGTAGSSDPPSQAAPAQGARQDPKTVTGPVAETMNAGDYTYVRVSTASGDVWAASRQFQVKVGDRVVVPLETPMQNFHSQTLNRDFPLIYFASHIDHEGQAGATAAVGTMPSMMASHGAGGTAAPATPTEPMAAPAGGMTIADVWAQRKSLAGKTVTVHGKVVKYNEAILGRNWLHLQDGTGKADDGTNDLAVTMNEPAKVGDTITVTGTVGIDKDFTAGYAYPVIVENAKIVK